MNALPPLGSLRQNLSQRYDAVREQRFFRDRLSLGLLIAGLVLNALTLALLGLRLHPTSFPVPISYSTLAPGFNGLGPWYQLYELGFFGLGVTLVNGWLAFNSFGRSRIASFFLLVGADVVGLFCLIIANAFCAVIS